MSPSGPLETGSLQATLSTKFNKKPELRKLDIDPLTGQKIPRFANDNSDFSHDDGG